MDIEFQDRS